MFKIPTAHLPDFHISNSVIQTVVLLYFLVYKLTLSCQNTGVDLYTRYKIRHLLITDCSYSYKNVSIFSLQLILSNIFCTVIKNCYFLLLVIKTLIILINQYIICFHSDDFLHMIFFLEYIFFLKQKYHLFQEIKWLIYTLNNPKYAVSGLKNRTDLYKKKKKVWWKINKYVIKCVKK